MAQVVKQVTVEAEDLDVVDSQGGKKLSFSLAPGAVLADLEISAIVPVIDDGEPKQVRPDTVKHDALDSNMTPTQKQNLLDLLKLVWVNRRDAALQKA